MKKILFTLISLFAIATSMHAMSYEQARDEALFLTDKMAYELNLTDAQYEAAYEINLDYLMSVSNRDNVFGSYWERRNMDIRYILYSWQWDAFCAATYFYRPLFWKAGYWHFGIYVRYPQRNYYYFGRPHFYASYRGGHSWRMNGGRSYYERHHQVYRPHVARDRHIGMRDGWNRGSYRSSQRGHSSTRITGTHRDTQTSGRRDVTTGRGGVRQSGSFSDRSRGQQKSGRSGKGDFRGQQNTNRSVNGNLATRSRVGDLGKTIKSSSAGIAVGRSATSRRDVSESRVESRTNSRSSAVSGSRSSVSRPRSSVSSSRSSVSSSRSSVSSSRSHSSASSRRGGGGRNSAR